ILNNTVIRCLPDKPKSLAKSVLNFLPINSVILSDIHFLLASLFPFSQPGKVGTFSITAKGTSTSSSTFSTTICFTSTIFSCWLVSVDCITVSTTSSSSFTTSITSVGAGGGGGGGGGITCC